MSLPRWIWDYRGIAPRNERFFGPYSHFHGPFTPFRWTPIKKQFRVLDQEDVYDKDDFFKIEIGVSPDPAFTDYISPDEHQRIKYRQQAHARAKAIVANIDLYRQAAAWRKRLQRASHEFEFVFEPYARQLKKKYGRDWWYEARYRPIPWQEPKSEYTAADRERDHATIKMTLAWVQQFNSQLLWTIVSKLINEQPTISGQAEVCRQIDRAQQEGRLQATLDYIFGLEKDSAA